MISYPVTLFHALRSAKTAAPENRLLFLTGASAFVFMALMMITDNIMVYVSYFGNLHFTILGIAYAAEKTSTANNKTDDPLTQPSTPLPISPQGRFG
ncbi:hypothetical protein ACFL0O_00980 [Thermodesulfobacteriota bacterium]